jgi:glycosyltransferase involved in cell wall biosynthesis
VRVLALVPYPLDIAPGQRYRCEQWAPYLAEQGIQLVFAPFASPELQERLYRPGAYMAKAWEMTRGLCRRVPEAWSAAHYDAVLVHREACLVGPAWAERLAHYRRPALVYDFDDAVYRAYVSPTNRYLSYLKFPGKTRTLCRLAAAVIAGNDHLADYARGYNPRVHVVPSTISLRTYRPREGARPERPPVIGWTGSHSSAQYLALVTGALQRLRRRHDFRFLVIGASGIAIPGVEVECRPWRSASEVEDLWDLDVGIMPLPDEPWARGKCGMKALQYMGVGIPAVVSPVGANREIVEANVNGFLPVTEDNWVEALDRLLTDSALRRSLGEGARRTVEARYSAEVQAPRVAEILREVVR